MQIPLRDIVVKNRIRKDLGDLSGLKDSIQRHGILNPIVINEHNELIAGHRRLESARQLGWNLVPVRVAEGVRDSRKLEMEIDENLYRKSLGADELAEAYERLEKLRNPGWFKQIVKSIRAFFLKIFKHRRKNMQ